MIILLCNKHWLIPCQLYQVRPHALPRPYLRLRYQQCGHFIYRPIMLCNRTPTNKFQWNLNQSKINFHSRECIWKYRLQYVIHFVQGSNMSKSLQGRDNYLTDTVVSNDYPQQKVILYNKRSLNLDTGEMNANYRTWLLILFIRGKDMIKVITVIVDIMMHA